MHYRKLWKKLGFNTPFYASMVEVFAFEAVLLIAIVIYTKVLLIPLNEPFHVMFKWLFIKIGHQPNQLQVQFLMRIIAYGIFIGLTFPIFRIIYNNMVNVLLPRVLRGSDLNDDNGQF